MSILSIIAKPNFAVVEHSPSNRDGQFADSPGRIKYIN